MALVLVNFIYWIREPLKQGVMRSFPAKNSDFIVLKNKCHCNFIAESDAACFVFIFIEEVDNVFHIANDFLVVAESNLEHKNIEIK